MEQPQESPPPVHQPASHPAANDGAPELQQPNRVKRYIQECLRVLKVTKKPTMAEFKTIVKVSGLGMLIIGLMGFIINLIKELFL